MKGAEREEEKGKGMRGKGRTVVVGISSEEVAE